MHIYNFLCSPFRKRAISRKKRQELPILQPLNIEEDGNLKQYILDLEINYGSLQKSKLSENEIHFRLASIFKRLASEILTKSFKSFEDYIELSDRI